MVEDMLLQAERKKLPFFFLVYVYLQEHPFMAASEADIQKLRNWQPVSRILKVQVTDVTESV